MEISIQTNIAEWTKDLEDVFKRQIPFATMQALNQTVDDVRDYHLTILSSIFDRPTRYTMNALRRVKSPNKDKLQAAIFFKEYRRDGSHYLDPQVHGGPRKHKRFEYWLVQRGLMHSSEFAVPASGMKLDAFGNIPNGVITMILSQLAVGPDAFQWETARSKKRAGSARARYFIPKAGSSLKRGIWRRISSTKIEPVLLFVSSTSYKSRYPFYEVTREKIAEYLPRNFEHWMQRGIDDQRRYSGLNQRSTWSMQSA